jgi:hypothetical protein
MYFTAKILLLMAGWMLAALFGNHKDETKEDAKTLFIYLVLGLIFLGIGGFLPWGGK